jgi:hypothetical protein
VDHCIIQKFYHPTANFRVIGCHDNSAIVFLVVMVLVYSRHLFFVYTNMASLVADYSSSSESDDDADSNGVCEV